MEIASEYRYRDSVPDARMLVVTLSQSGETADTLAALKHARSLGMLHTLTICNVATNAMVRECKLRFLTHAGVEIGVASTKAFTTQFADSDTHIASEQGVHVILMPALRRAVAHPAGGAVAVAGQPHRLCARHR